MAFPVRVSFGGIGSSDALEQHVRRKAQKLGRRSRWVTYCDVAIDAPNKHHVSGNHFRVRIHVGVPGGPIVVDQGHTAEPATEDAHALVEVAFDDVGRQVLEHARKRRDAAYRRHG